MSKLDEKIELYKNELKRLNIIEVEEELITKVTKGLGPSIYRADSEIVSCSDYRELDRVRENFLKKKLGLEFENKKLDDMIKEVCQKMGSSNRRKYRAIFYALLVKMTKKENKYS